MNSKKILVAFDSKTMNSLLSTKLENIILGHLSQENNLAELAYETVRMEVTMSDTGFRFSDLRVLIGKRNERTELLTV